ncbi:MAG: gliding motility lipoprotein GldB [Flavobacteriaceae bacterium]|nr:gliding motility lipoprotein GldB [Flavobacteriaceae bacterium]
MKTRFIIFVVTFLMFSSCRKEKEIEADISTIETAVRVERFDLKFNNSSIAELDGLKQEYPFMFSSQFTNEDYAARLTDSLQIELRGEVKRIFSEFTETDDIEMLYKHLKFYFKTFRDPRLIAVTSDVDYRNKIIVTDTIVLIALDNYLGEDHEFYSGIPNYIRKNLRREMMVSDLAQAYGDKILSRPDSRTFLNHLIYQGKLLYLKDLIIPFVDDDLKIGYSPDQLEWAKANESNIWSYFVEKELLYDTDPKLISRFINPAPFSKFNLELDRESPGMLGRYIGWQIVRSYMANNEKSLQELLSTDAEEIFNNARFKPRKE